MQKRGVIFPSILRLASTYMLCGIRKDFTIKSTKTATSIRIWDLRDLKFLTIIKSEMEKNTCILHSPSILKHILGVQDHSITLQKSITYKNIFIVFLHFCRSQFTAE